MVWLYRVREGFYEKITGMVMIGCSLCMVPTNAMANSLAALPMTDGIVLEGQELMGLTGYSIGDKNYFKLRDLGSALGVQTNWNKETKEIVLLPIEADTSLEGEKEKNTEKKVAKAVIQAIWFGKEKETFAGYVVEDNTYFSVRDVANLLGYACTWDEAKGQVALEKGESTVDGLQVSAQGDALVNDGFRRTADTHVIEGNDVTYRTNSKNYMEVADYIRENIGEDFSMAHYGVEEVHGIQDIEKYTGLGGEPFTVPNNLLRFRYVVNGVTSNYGYDVKVLEGVAKTITPIGEWNEQFDIEKVIPFPYTDAQLKELILKTEEDLTRNITVEEMNIRKYFDMKTLKITAEVAVLKRKGETYLRGDVLTFS